MSGCHIYLRQSVGLNRESAEEAPTTERVIAAVCHMDSSHNYIGGLKMYYKDFLEQFKDDPDEYADWNQWLAESFAF